MGGSGLEPHGFHDAPAKGPSKCVSKAYKGVFWQCRLTLSFLFCQANIDQRGLNKNVFGEPGGHFGKLALFHAFSLSPTSTAPPLCPLILESDAKHECQNQEKVTEVA